MESKTNDMTKQHELSVPKGRSTSTISFKDIPILGNTYNTMLSADNFLFSTKTFLYMQSLLKLSTVTVSINKIMIVWCPHLEPTVDSNVSLKVRYLQSEGIGRGSLKSNIVASISGVSTEHHEVTIYPSHSLVVLKKSKLKLPWKLEFNHDAGHSVDNVTAIGTIKIWCFMSISLYHSHRPVNHLSFKCPDFDSSTLYRPYHVPITIMQTVRGLSLIGIEEHDNTKEFEELIKCHIDNNAFKQDVLWIIQNVMSHDDAQRIKDATEQCLIKKGGSYCTCGDKVKTILTLIHNNSTKSGLTGYNVYKNMRSMINEGKAHDIGSISLRR